MGPALSYTPMGPDRLMAGRWRPRVDLGRVGERLQAADDDLLNGLVQGEGLRAHTRAGRELA